LKLNVIKGHLVYGQCLDNTVHIQKVNIYSKAST